MAQKARFADEIKRPLHVKGNNISHSRKSNDDCRYMFNNASDAERFVRAIAPMLKHEEPFSLDEAIEKAAPFLIGPEALVLADIEDLIIGTGAHLSEAKLAMGYPIIVGKQGKNIDQRMLLEEGVLQNFSRTSSDSKKAVYNVSTQATGLDSNMKNVATGRIVLTEDPKNSIEWIDVLPFLTNKRYSNKFRGERFFMNPEYKAYCTKTEEQGVVYSKQKIKKSHARHHYKSVNMIANEYKAWFGKNISPMLTASFFVSEIIKYAGAHRNELIEQILEFNSKLVPNDNEWNDVHYLFNNLEFKFNSEEKVPLGNDVEFYTLALPTNIKYYDNSRTDVIKVVAVNPLTKRPFTYCKADITEIVTKEELPYIARKGFGWTLQPIG